jgi:methionine-rich copper-binding protein CopC
MTCFPRPALIGAAMLTATSLAAPAPALAHAVLIDSLPVPDGHVAAGSIAIKFRYNSRIDAPRSKLTLTRPDASTSRLTTNGEGPDLLEANITLTPGAYTLHWQVLAIDGHITRGNVPFTVDAGPHPAMPGN